MKKLTYFISYTTRDENDVKRAKWVELVLRNELRAETIIQAYDFKVGDNFKTCMHQALMRADAVVCVGTRTYFESENCIILGRPLRDLTVRSNEPPIRDIDAKREVFDIFFSDNDLQL
ncbi:MAG: toll/interleukin-1 receptor domain-containing protein [Clostridiales Family XIII bacterium]|jgi:hypothetical protein|nr:toll/interleukin-1 receptor domain-containing protein [Clostridiales Family XIII bacterium]